MSIQQNNNFLPYRPDCRPLTFNKTINNLPLMRSANEHITGRMPILGRLPLSLCFKLLIFKLSILAIITPLTFNLKQGKGICQEKQIAKQIPAIEHFS